MNLQIYWTVSILRRETSY